jgi:hypothetical protein
MWFSELIHKFLIGDIEVAMKAGFKRIFKGSWFELKFLLHEIFIG